MIATIPPNHSKFRERRFCIECKIGSIGRGDRNFNFYPIHRVSVTSCDILRETQNECIVVAGVPLRITITILTLKVCVNDICTVPSSTGFMDIS
jgi:hypothetical protein